MRWFTTLKNHLFRHLANHFEREDGCIYLDMFLADGATLNVFPNMHPELDSGKPERQIKGKFVRFKIDPHAESTELELLVVLSDIVGEMPRCDDRFTTKPYNNAFGTWFTPSETSASRLLRSYSRAFGEIRDRGPKAYDELTGSEAGPIEWLICGNPWRVLH